MTTHSAERGVRLDPMTEDEFAAWLVQAVRHYADEHVRSGRWSEQDAPQFARTEYMTLLPKGLQSGEQHLYTARETAGGAPVGTLWLAMRLRAGKPEAFVYDIKVHEAQRGKGYGRATMTAAVAEARRLGAVVMSLHVFGHNAVARNLYSSLGFAETNVNMSLPLEDEGTA
jgi:ribosomal protein S18 acetylase RimI-like enzyme